MTKRIVILGAGLTALMGAILAKKRWVNSEVILIKTATVFGGHLRGYEYENGLYFDTGTHIFQESGIAEIDNELLQCVPKDDLIVFEKGQGDIVGGIYDNKLEHDSHFPLAKSQEARLEIEKKIQTMTVVPPIDRMKSCMELGIARFGSIYTNQTLKPILESMYGIPLDKLSSFAMLLPGLTRVKADSMADWLIGQKNEHWRAIFGIPEQRHLPDKYQNNRRSFYSRNRGTRSFIDGITNKLRLLGIKIFECTGGISINYEDSEIQITSEDNRDFKMQYDALFSGLGAVGISRALDIEIGDFGLDRPLPHTLFHVALSGRVHANCYYFYGFESKSSIYRVTNYDAFCPSPSDGLSRITIEALGDNSDQKSLDLILEELSDLGVLDRNHVIFSAIEKLPSGFPSPTVVNFQAMQKLANQIENTLPENIYLGGAGHGDGHFFQNEVIPHMYNLIKTAEIC